MARDGGGAIASRVRFIAICDLRFDEVTFEQSWDTGNCRPGSMQARGSGICSGIGRSHGSVLFAIHDHQLVTAASSMRPTSRIPTRPRNTSTSSRV